MALSDEQRIVYALRLYEEHGSGAVAEAERRMEEAQGRSFSDWATWLTIRNGLRRFLEPRP